MTIKIKKISIRIYLIVFVVIISVFSISFLLNNFFLGKYYTYKTKIRLDGIYNYANSVSLKEFESNVNQIEIQNNVTILFESPNENVDQFNDNVQLSMQRERVNIGKLWISKDVINAVNSGDYVNKIFYQSKLQSNYFIKIFKKENQVVIIGTSMANEKETVGIINQFNLLIISFAIIISLLLVWLFTRKTINSLDRLKSLSDDISNLKFNNVDIKTGDEIEELAHAFNAMSESLKNAHMELESKNEDLKLLISSISHEVKTPLALIKAYTIAIKDGLDDGTFADIIINQVDNSSEMVNNLLELSKVQRGVINKEEFDFIDLFNTVIGKYKINFENKNISLNINYDNINSFMVFADKAQLSIVLNNFISNSIKYNFSNFVDISFDIKDEKLVFSIANKARDISEENIKKIWEPFYVVDESRNKEVSGTGLGLSIVKNILENHNIKYFASFKDQIIIFNIEIEKI